ncbi:MAG: hypothetical protein RIC14_15465 [Filomicrobium sp.]
MSTLAQTTILLASVITIMLPFSVVAAEAFSEPAAFSRLSGAPLQAVVALTGVATWLIMFGVPACRAFARLGRSQTIIISNGIVEVAEKTIIGRHAWTIPLAEFTGISHHVRTNLSGTRQELILVHPQTSKSLLIEMGASISHNDAEKLANTLKLPVLPAGVLHRRCKARETESAIPANASAAFSA